jgi:hypothetical protein
MPEPSGRFPPPWHAIPCRAATSSGTPHPRSSTAAIPRTRHAQAKVLTNDEARRIAVYVARLPELLEKGEPDCKAESPLHRAGCGGGGPLDRLGHQNRRLRSRVRSRQPLTKLCGKSQSAAVLKIERCCHGGGRGHLDCRRTHKHFARCRYGVEHEQDGLFADRGQAHGAKRGSFEADGWGQLNGPTSSNRIGFSFVDEADVARRERPWIDLQEL